MRFDTGLNRRSLIASSLALAACDASPAISPGPTEVAPLKSLVPFPVGTCAQTRQFDDPRWVHLLTTHFSQTTAEWEFQTEAILDPYGNYDFTRPDALAQRASDLGLRLYGTSLVWHVQESVAMRSLAPDEFRAAFDRWVHTMTTRYRGKVAGWDVVNEPIMNDGSGQMRQSLFADRLGLEDYIPYAFEHAKAGDPDAVLFINEYNLENWPAKRAAFLRVIEQALSRGAPIDGIGTQSHLDIEIPGGQITDMMRELAEFGLPIHVSELDASRRSDRRIDLRSPQEKLNQQTARVQELAEAYAALPAYQQFAFTVWGIRDTDSWLRRGDKDDGEDSPLLFDAEGRANPMYQAVVDGWRGAAGA